MPVPVVYDMHGSGLSSTSLRPWSLGVQRRVHGLATVEASIYGSKRGKSLRES